MNKIIMLVDMESFYASVEVAKNPLRGKPVVVCGDRNRGRIVLAATREAKTLGVKTGMTAGECTRLSSQLVFVRPHMQDYIDTSLKITKILEKFTDRIRPYSIDEQFLDMTGCEKLFGNPKEMAKLIIKKVWESTGIRCRVGIGENPLPRWHAIGLPKIKTAFLSYLIKTMPFIRGLFQSKICLV